MRSYFIQGFDHFFQVRENDRDIILEVSGANAALFRMSIDSARKLAEALTNVAEEAENKYKNVIPIRGQ